MHKRTPIKDIEPKAFKAMLNLEAYMNETQLEPQLKELIKIRVSQINGCAYCLDMHTEEALKIGETDRRIFALSAWKESHLFSEDEKNVLQLAEEITLIAQQGVRDETYEKVERKFGPQVTAQIIMQIVVINSWNRIAISAPSIYKP